MTVLVDTSVWSLALRRKHHRLSPLEQSLTRALTELIKEGRAQIIGPIRQELLSGIREPRMFERIRGHLRAFDDLRLHPDDYEEAARTNNECRRRGITGSAIDFLICAVAHRRDWHIFTTDRDFVAYSKVVPLKLYRAI